MSVAEPLKSRKERLLEEIRNYAVITAYLYVCFSILLLYKSSILGTQGVAYLPFGLALGKALILGKFILIGDALKIGSRFQSPTLAQRILLRSFLLLMLLLLLSALEELLVGWAHGLSAMEALSTHLNRPVVELVAPPLVMFLVLIPLIAFEEVSRSLGHGVLRQLLLGRSQA